MRSGRLVLVAVGLLVTACTSTPHRSGHASRSTAGPASGSSATHSGRSTPPSGSTSLTTSAAPTPPPRFVRTRFDTAIGDPGTADLCAAVGARTFGRLGTGTAVVDPVQYPPGCSFTLSNPSGPVLTVSVFAARQDAPAADGRRTKRTSAGLDVYSYPFDPHTGGCARQVMADGVRLVADAITRGSAEPDKQLSCGATDAMADRVAEVAANRSVPRLSLAQPSVVLLRACAIARDAGITELSDFADGRVIPRGFSVNCEVRAHSVFLFITASIATTVPPPRATRVTVGGHDLYEIASRPRFCSYVSVQGTAGDAHHEEITADATAQGRGKPPAQLCDQTARALALYLTSVGLS